MAISLSGSLELTGSLIVTGGVTMSGSIASASYALNSSTASYVLNAVSSSYTSNAELLDGRDSLTFAGTGSNAFVGQQNIDGNTAITGSLTTTGTITAQTLNVQQVTSSIVYSSGSNVFGNSTSNTQSMTGSVGISGSLGVVGAGTFSSSVTATGLYGYILKGRASDNYGAFGFYSNDAASQYGYIQSHSTNGGQLSVASIGGGILALDNRGLTVTGAATFSSQIISNSASDILSATSSNTFYKWINLANSGGNLVVGINTSVGGATMSTSPYASYIFTRNATDLVLGTNEVPRLTIASTGAATFSNNVLIEANQASSPLIYAKQTGSSGYTAIQFSGNNGTDIGAFTTYNGEIYLGGWNGGNGSLGQLRINRTTGDTTFTGTTGNLPRITLLRSGIISWFVGNPTQSTSNNFSIGTDSGGNTNILNITNTGNVGIGTTTDAGYKLDVNGTGRFSGKLTISNTSEAYTEITTSGAGADALLGFSNTGDGNSSWGIGRRNTGEFWIANYTGNFNSGTRTTPLTIASTGAATFSSSVGVGGTPSGTYGTLSVFGGVSIKNDNSAKLEIGRYSAAASNSYIKLGANSNSLRVTNNTDITDIFVIENDGNVGIGTTSPDVTGFGWRTLTIKGGTGSGDAGVLELQSPTTTGAANLGIIAFLDGSNRNGQISVQRDTSTSTSNMMFYTNAGAGITERMRITSDGTLQVNNNSTNGVVSTNFRAYAYSSNSFFRLGNNTSNSLNIELTRSDSAIMFSVNGHSGAGYLNSSAWSYGSDRRIKENINYIISGLDKVLNLKPAKFDYINGSKNNIGWIAQDIQDVIPEAVSVLSETNDQLTLKSDFIIPYLVKAIQEQNELIQTLSARITQLEN